MIFKVLLNSANSGNKTILPKKTKNFNKAVNIENWARPSKDTFSLDDKSEVKVDHCEHMSQLGYRFCLASYALQI